ncbi:hypothetical protein [Streptomyces sp. NPDC002133]|uniref:hypothetical protein n=1 Tax=Streptomyces sp. NPDC002133 TaxID=3154409 RepID=UPI003316D656
MPVTRSEEKPLTYARRRDVIQVPFPEGRQDAGPEAPEVPGSVPYGSDFGPAR